MIRRVRRASLHRESNHARVNAYTDRLTALFDDWVARVEDVGYSSAALIDLMDRAAQQEFPRSFALGRHQAYPKSRPGVSPSLRDRLDLNRHYLQNSLAPAIDDRVVKWRLAKETIPLSEALSKSFRARIGMYGGTSWQVTEAGYKAGLAEVRVDMAKRLTGHLMAEEGDDEEPQPGDEGLAVALGLTLVGFMALLAVGRDSAGVTPVPDPEQQQMVALPGILDSAGIAVLTAYHAENDDATCDGCAADSTGGDGDGVYPEDECPLPGDDCAGGPGRCRCWIETVVNEP